MSDIVYVIESSVKSFLHRYGGGHIIVGLSGGADSVALLAALVAAGAKCTAAHCNFGLRGPESERDMEHALSVAATLGVECLSVRFDVAAHMAAHKCSLETACRELRYEWFETQRTAIGADFIAVAHHRDDNNETLLLNLLRGTGVSGLRGMRPLNGKILRPLLAFSRSDIERYINAKGLSYITDSSNLVSDVARNKIRNLIMPCIRESFPNADHTIALTSANLYSADTFIAEMIEQERAHWTNESGAIDIDALTAGRKSADFILIELLKPHGINSSQVRDILAASKAGISGKLFTGKDGARFLLNRGRLELLTEAAPLPQICVATVGIDEFTPGKDPYTEYFAASVLDGEPLTLRHWITGDRMTPFGMKGSRLVSDIMSDSKLSVAQKAAVPILVKGDKILWVAGLRRSNAYPVHPDDSVIVRIQLSPARKLR